MNVEHGPLYGVETPIKRSPSKCLLITASVLGIGLIVAIGSKDSEEARPSILPTETLSAQEIFGFEIPPSIKNLDEALEYARQEQYKKGIGQQLIDNGQIELNIGGGGIPELPQENVPDIYIRIHTREGYEQLQKEWTDNLITLFEGMDICEGERTEIPEKKGIVISWNRVGGFEEIGLDPEQASQTPGCKVDE